MKLIKSSLKDFARVGSDKENIILLFDLQKLIAFATACLAVSELHK